MKQGCVLAFSLSLRHLPLPTAVLRLQPVRRCMYLHTRGDGNLFSRARLRAKIKVRKVLITKGDAVCGRRCPNSTHRGCSTVTCSEFGLTVSLKKINVLGQDFSSIPSISIGDYTLEVVGDFSYLGPTISSNLSLDTELNKRIGKAAAALARLEKRVWENTMYQACVLSTLLYGSETWTLYSCQERIRMRGESADGREQHQHP